VQIVCIGQHEALYLVGGVADLSGDAVRQQEGSDVETIVDRTVLRIKDDSDDGGVATIVPSDVTTCFK